MPRGKQSNRSSDTPDSGRHLILYDGTCGFCNLWVRRVLPRDPEGVFHFASLQSEAGTKILSRYGKNPQVVDTMYVVGEYTSASPSLHSRAQAALFVLERLAGPCRVLGFLKVLPDSLLDRAYSMVARHRYRLFGRYDHCPVPEPGVRDRFVGL